MSETRESREGVSTAAPAGAVEYQPPAIAWEEPLEAIAACSCGLVYLGPERCQGSVTAC